MNRLILIIIVATVFYAVVENVLPEGSIKKPALGVVALIVIAMAFAPISDVFIKAKENRLFKKGDVFIEKN